MSSKPPFRVCVPATSANLGPGFDAIGLALDLWSRATIQSAVEFSISFKAGTYVPTNAGFENEIIRGMDRVLGGVRPKVSVQIANDIPLGKGLGASAAGAVLGIVIGAELAAERPTEETLAGFAAELEGHPDNALPALLGGVVVAAMAVGEAPAYLRFDPPAGLAAVVVTPRIVLPTAAARALLPATYERRDVVFNLQRAALLAASLATGDLHALRVAVGDRIHQPYRAPLVPGFTEMLGFSMPGLLALALSGAGPSVIALVSGESEAIGKAMSAAFAREGIDSDVFHLGIATRGAYVEELGTALPRRTLMPISVAQIRALESRRVTLRTPNGDISGHVAQAPIPEAALMVMFALDAPPGDLVVVAIGDILELVER